MSQLNSERMCLACDWQYSVEGDPSTFGVAGLNMGLAINPGYFIEGGYYNIMEPITTSGNPAVDTVRIFFFVDFFGTTLILGDTINNINALLLDAWYYTTYGPPVANGQVMQNPLAIAQPGVCQIKIASTAPLTGGRIATAWSVIGMNIK